MLDNHAAVPIRRFRLPVAFALSLALLVAAAAAQAQVWAESGDAGDLVATAQQTAGTGALITINGSLASPTDVDMYCVHVTAVPPAGSAMVQLACAVISGPNVWMFDAAGNGVFVNETCQGGFKTILAPNVSLPTGTYYLAVSYSEVDPNSAGGPIWLPALPGQRAPDGPGSAGSVIGWGGTPNVQPINPYRLTLSYMGYCSAATPTANPTWGSLKSHYR